MDSKEFACDLREKIRELINTHGGIVDARKGKAYLDVANIINFCIESFMENGNLGIPTYIPDFLI